MITVGIIGTAGRGPDRCKMTRELYNQMIFHCEKTIESFGVEKRNVHLVSGGAAWSDHIAVHLFLTGEYGNLTIHLPCPWDSEIPAHHDNGSNKSSQNPGRTANGCHQYFSEIVKYDTLRQIEESKDRGAILRYHSGFHDRNTFVANSQYLIAFSSADGDAPTRGGTMNTWNKCHGQRKIHIPINLFISSALSSPLDQQEQKLKQKQEKRKRDSQSDGDENMKRG